MLDQRGHLLRSAVVCSTPASHPSPKVPMRRIGLAVVITLNLFLAPLAADAQQAGKAPRIGFLSLTSFR
jgi:hypothetical protein